MLKLKIDGLKIEGQRIWQRLPSPLSGNVLNILRYNHLSPTEGHLYCNIKCI